MPRTRSEDFFPVFGKPETFNDNMLPTYADVIRCYSYIQQEHLWENKQEPVLDDVCSQLIKDIKCLWEKSPIPIVSQNQIRHKIRE